MTSVVIRPIASRGELEACYDLWAEVFKTGLISNDSWISIRRAHMRPPGLRSSMAYLSQPFRSFRMKRPSNASNSVSAGLATLRPAQTIAARDWLAPFCELSGGG
jgi:hypothetical protein